MLGRVFAHGELEHRLSQIVAPGAAQAAVAELGHAVVVHVFYERPIDVDVTELVDDHPEALAAVFDQVIDERRLARAEKATDDRDRNFSFELEHLLKSLTEVSREQSQLRDVQVIRVTI